eukprot:2747098-Amphidinium_carterae.2
MFVLLSLFLDQWTTSKRVYTFACSLPRSQALPTSWVLKGCQTWVATCHALWVKGRRLDVVLPNLLVRSLVAFLQGRCMYLVKSVCCEADDCHERFYALQHIFETAAP